MVNTASNTVIPLKVVKKVDLKCFHKKEKCELCEIIEILPNPTVVIISQYTYIKSSHCIPYTYEIL